MAKVIELGQITEEIINSWVEKYERREDGYYCRTCGSRIQMTTCYVSIHLKLFEPACAGPGRVARIRYPYCPKCDGEIDFVRACYHVDLDKRILLEKVSKTTGGKTLTYDKIENLKKLISEAREQSEVLKGLLQEAQAN
jgi:hypothetical protein